MAGQRRDNLVGDGFDIERFGQCGHAWIRSEVLEGANGYKSASRAHGRSWPEPTSRDVGYSVAIDDKADKGLTLSKDRLSLAPSFRQPKFLELGELWAETRTCRNARYANA
jgi:hypothetical protein